MHKENLSAKLYLETTFSMEIQQNMKTLVSEILRLHFTYSYHYNNYVMQLNTSSYIYCESGIIRKVYY